MAEVSFGWKKTVIYSLLPAIVLLTTLEVAARITEIWLPPWRWDYGWGFVPGSQAFMPSESDPAVMVTNPSKGLHPQAFPVEKPSNHIRIFMVGESSVYQLFDDLGESAKRLNARFNNKYVFECLDAGIGAYGSHRLAPLLAELINYDPDLILIYMGHNEFCEADHLKLAQIDLLPLQRILYKSAFCRFVRDRLGARQVSKAQREKNRQILSSNAAPWEASLETQYTPEQIQERMAAFHNNYSIMVELCRTKKIPLVIGTIPSNLWNPDLLGHPEKLAQVQACYARGDYAAGKTLAQEVLVKSKRYQSSDAENAIIRELAKRYNVPLADVETAVTNAEPHAVPGETCFTDRCHLNRKGNEILMQQYEEKIIPVLTECGITR